MSDINDAMGIRPDTDQTIEPKPEPAKPKPKPNRSRPSRAKPKPTAEDSTTPPPRPARPAEPATTRIRQGQTCPKCSRGLIGVIRTRLYRLKNKRVVVLGCRNQTCFWDLDGDNERVSPINPGRPIDD